ncbi:DUF3365 domain-containing protein [[Limnothrix rosea] IAM M-220]|uniref:Tll0287-like domain-containing protein n=1 Tax=[Limnothrix rosea] IAM M-220 TaxID=454133 RepID=UPI000959563C|nr:DUF3365 domain-containing protein [[Limnothrix rosea] IAM M-220]OKH15143.1 hypothetical protein NIES208_13190 [[Limnothrix rosea] IAM M-220]
MCYGKLWRGFCAGFVAIALILIKPDIVLAAVNPPEFGYAVQAIEELDAMRSGLASTLEPGSDITPETMREVCKPVGMQAKKLGVDNGWQVKQVAKKYRNLDHAPQTLRETMAIAKFEQDPELLSFSQTAQDGLHYYRRINVESSCLACHGAKNDRPNFIKAKYLDDLAYDFKVGDLRGMYSVLMPTLESISSEL